MQRFQGRLIDALAGVSNRGGTPFHVTFRCAALSRRPPRDAAFPRCFRVSNLVWLNLSPPMNSIALESASAVGATSAASADIPGADGDSARWFSEEIQPHEPALRAYLRARFPTLRDVDDQIQDTYARIFRAKKSGRGGLTRGYIFLVARNAALDLFRRRRVVSFVGLAEIDVLAETEERPAAGDVLDREQELQLLDNAINALPERCREIFVLRRFHDLSHREIAQRFGVSEHTVNAQLVIGMTRCREYLRIRRQRAGV